MKIITKKIAEDKTDSIFYHDKTIAVVDREDGSKLYARATGEIQLSFTDGGKTYKGDAAAAEVVKRGLTDRDIEQLASDDRFSLNNWFVVEEIDKNGDYVDDLEIQHDYDSIINQLKELE